MRAIWYLFRFILKYVIPGKHSLAEAMDFYHYTKTVLYEKEPIGQ